MGHCAIVHATSAHSSARNTADVLSRRASTACANDGLCTTGTRQCWCVRYRFRKKDASSHGTIALSDGTLLGEDWGCADEEVCGDPDPAGEGSGPALSAESNCRGCRGSGGIRSSRPRSPSGTDGSSHVSRAEPNRLAGVGPAIGALAGASAATPDTPGFVAAGKTRADGTGVRFFVLPSGRPGFLCTYVNVHALSCFAHARQRSEVPEGVHFTCCQLCSEERAAAVW